MPSIWHQPKTTEFFKMIDGSHFPYFIGKERSSFYNPQANNKAAGLDIGSTQLLRGTPAYDFSCFVHGTHVQL